MGNPKKTQNPSVNDMDYLEITKEIKESPRIQKTEYIRQQMLKRREKEDALMAQLLQEQNVIDTFRDQISDGLRQTDELSRYNLELKENMTEQIYSLHGISMDKLEGMHEYKNAMRRGCNIILFLLSVSLTVLCGVLYGFQSELCLLMLACIGVEGAILAIDQSDYPVISFLCRILYILIFPAMLGMFICYELKMSAYELILPYASIAGIIILVISALPYFLYNPYRKVKKKLWDAKAQIKEVEKAARKEVDKNQKIREKEEKKEQIRQQREERAAQRASQKQARIEQKEAQKQAQIAQKEAKKQDLTLQEETQKAVAAEAITTEDTQTNKPEEIQKDITTETSEKEPEQPETIRQKSRPKRTRTSKKSAASTTETTAETA
ncbi:MAG: hypothetical protein ACI4DW_08630 [Lachnospiraceae bacterium]